MADTDSIAGSQSTATNGARTTGAPGEGAIAATEGQPPGAATIKRTAADRAAVDDAAELVWLLAERGITADPADTRAIVEAAGRNDADWTAEAAAALIAARGRLAVKAQPATLDGLRFAREHRGRDATILLCLIGFAALAAIIWLQAALYRINDVQTRVAAYEVSRDAELPDSARAAELNRQIDAQIGRLRSPFWMADGGMVPSPMTAHEREVLRATGATWASTLATYLLPTLYGLLGAVASMLRSHSSNVRAGLVTRGFTGEYFIRGMLGMVAGLAIGMFIATTGTPESGLVTLTPMALAFVAGYAVELLFGIVDRFVGTTAKPDAGKPE